MKKIYLILILCQIVLETQAQTILQYSGTSTVPTIAGSGKVGGIGDNFITTNTAVFHAGLYGRAMNATNYNIGVLGTTYQNTVGNSSGYYAVWGDNSSHPIASNNGFVVGGYFTAENTGTNGTSQGISATANSSNNSNSTIGVNSLAVNSANTTVNRTIAVKGVTTSGQSTVTNIFKDVANPGGYFSSSDGQGIYRVFMLPPLELTKAVQLPYHKP